MNRLKCKLSDALRPAERGQTLVEYGMILAMIALVAIPAVAIMAGGLGGLYDTILEAADVMAKAVSGS